MSIFQKLYKLHLLEAQGSLF